MNKIKNWIWKARVLKMLLVSTFDQWKKEILLKDPDELQCCSGGSGPWDICGCFGATIREIYSWDVEDTKKD